MTTLEIVSLAQRSAGIIAISLMALQIFLGATRKNVKLHMTLGILAYSFVLLHPILMIVMRRLTVNQLDPFYVFVDVCVLCDGLYETILNFGRIGFWLVTIAVVAAKFRNINEWLKNNWRKLHPLNYLAFFIVSYHAKNIGTDSTKLWFNIYFIFLQIVVLYSAFIRVKTLGWLEKLKRNPDQ